MVDNRSLGILLQLGWTAALAVLIPLVLGLWLDRRLSASPLFILVGASLGIVLATIGVVRVTLRSIKGLAEPLPKQPAEMEGKEDQEQC